jgi:hypothetical protein
VLYNDGGEDGIVHEDCQGLSSWSTPVTGKITSMG